MKMLFNTKKKRRIIGALIAIGIIASFFNDDEVEVKDTQEKSEAEVAVKNDEKQEVVIDQKQEVQLFFEQLTSIEKPFNPIMDEVTKALNNNDRFGAYDAANKAHTSAKNISYEYANLEVPSGLDEEVKELLEGAKEDMELAYFLKKEGIESLQKFLDSQKPSDLQGFKDDSNSSQVYVIGATTKMMQAKEKVGLPIE